MQLQQLVDFETPSGLSDNLASQLESTRAPDAPHSLRLELSEITASTPTNSRMSVQSLEPTDGATRVPFASLIEALDTSEKSAIEEDGQDLFDELPSEDWNNDEGTLGESVGEERSQLPSEDWTDDEIETLAESVGQEMSKSSSKKRNFREERRSKAMKKVSLLDSSESFTSINMGNSTALVCNVCKSCLKGEVQRLPGGL